MSEKIRETSCSRRTLLKAGTGAVAATATGATGTAMAQSDQTYDGYLDNAGNYDGTTVDLTGRESVTIDVGAGNGLQFAPPAVQVDPGTTVTWEWTGNGGAHNVVAEDDSFRSGDTVADEGTTFEQTLDEEGVVKYYCNPHQAGGMKGVVAVGDTAEGQVETPSGGGDGGDGDGASGDGGGSEEPQPDFGGYLDDANNFDGSVMDARGQSSVTVDVGAGNGFAFGPAAVHVDAGTTVTWEWTGNGGLHNVVAVDESFRSGDTVEEAGTTFEQTFEEDGINTYYCNPHEAAGMKGAVVVGDEFATQGGDGGSGGGGDGGESGGGDSGGGGDGGAEAANQLALQTLAAMLALGLLSPIIFVLIARNKLRGTQS